MAIPKALKEFFGTIAIVHPGGILGSSNPSAGTNTVLYTVPARTTVEITTLSACNRGAAEVVIRAALLASGGSSPSNAEYLYYNLKVDANSTLMLDAAHGLWLQTAATLVVYAAPATVSFLATGLEHQ